MEQRHPAPRSFRLVCPPDQAERVLDLLAAEGVASEPEPFSPLCRRLTAEPLPLGSTLAAYFGFIHIQDRSSMLPPLLLDPEPGAAVLDMCAAPGGKTGFLAQLVGPDGFVLGNDPSPDRLVTLRQTLFRENLANAATCGQADLWPVLAPGQPSPRNGRDGRHGPAGHGGRAGPGGYDGYDGYGGFDGAACPDGAYDPDESRNDFPGSFDAVLLDPPCSGWGTAAKNPRVTTLWREDKTEPLIALQRRLLETAVRLLRPGGRLMYSTCTTNQAENEDQTRFALDHLPLATVPLETPSGFVLAPPARPDTAGALRINGPASAAQGFYLSLFRKAGGPDAPPDRSGPLGPAGPSGPERDTAKTRRSRPDPDGWPGEPLDLSGEPDLDLGRLPPGRVRLFGQRAYFIHASHGLTGSRGLVWRGFFLGQTGRGRLRPHPRARLLLPDMAPGRGLDMDDPALARALLSGQSIRAGDHAGRAGLYFRGLGLGFATAKGRRIMWSDR